MTQTFCTDDFTIIRFIGEGTFGEVYEIFDKRINKKLALKVAKKTQFTTHNDEIKKEIIIMKTLAEKKIRNVTQYMRTGKCSRLQNRVFYTMDLYDMTVEEFIKNKNVITSSEFFSIFFELLIALKDFRKFNFRHRDIHLGNVLLKIISKKHRLYVLENGESIEFSKGILPAIADFNTSIFRTVYDTGQDVDKELETDTRGLLEVIIDLVDVSNLGDYHFTMVNEIIESFEDDEFTSEFLDIPLGKIREILMNMRSEVLVF